MIRWNRFLTTQLQFPKGIQGLLCCWVPDFEIISLLLMDLIMNPSSVVYLTVCGRFVLYFELITKNYDVYLCTSAAEFINCVRLVAENYYAEQYFFRTSDEKYTNIMPKDKSSSSG